MSKRSFFWFAVFVAVFAIAVPIWAVNKEGSSGSSPQAVDASQEDAKELFVVNCGACHTLEKAGTDGIVGPKTVAAVRAATGRELPRVPLKPDAMIGL